MGVHDGHRERLRTRFLKSGLEHFEEHEVLELILFYARPRCDTNAIAHRLIKRFGSFAGVMDASYDELLRVEGVGSSSAVLIKLLPTACGYYYANLALPGAVLDSTEKAGAYFMPRFVGKRSEEVWLACLDDKRKVLRCECVSADGIVNAVRITIKQIVVHAVNANATGVLMAHNHPGGVAIPSSADKHMTAQAYQALSLINVQLVDHIIVADCDFVSMADSGFIEQIRREKGFAHPHDR